MILRSQHLPWRTIGTVLLLAIGAIVLYSDDTRATTPWTTTDPATISPSFPVADTTKPQSKGPLSRRARIVMEQEAEARSEQRDTSFNELAAIRALPRDSSARMEQFLAVRHDPRWVDPLRPKTHAMYLAEPLYVQYRDQLDSAQWSYRVTRRVGAWDTKTPLDYSLDQYRKLRMERTIRANWVSLAQTYTLEGEKKTGLSELFGKVTNIQIPVPKNPIFSIFGPNIINLHINGGVDVQAGFRNTKSDLIANNPLGQSRSEPEFKQDVQVTVEGQIGDKLKINADWDTKRQFEYENQLRVKYTGYEDDMVQNVEAGNVSLPINSSFISSSQALFGIKAGFQFGPLRLTAVASQKKGQIKELAVSGGARPTPFDKAAPDYSRDHYFLDTRYISEYENIFNKIPAQPNPALQVRDIEVWVTKTTSTYQLGERDAVAYIDVARVLADTSGDARRQPAPSAVSGEVEVGRFIKLQQGVNADYILNEYAGIISMNTAIQPDQAIAVAYAIPDSIDLKTTRRIGTFGSLTTDSLRLVLKLVKPRYLDPSFPVAWQLMIKNRYPLGGRGIKKEGFDLRIEYNISGQTPVQTVLNNVNLVQMFGLDRYKDDGTPGSDGKFDYIPGYTIDENRGEVIFPTLEPFSKSSIQKFLASLPTPPADPSSAADSFSFDALYDTTYTGAINSNRNKFGIRGNFTPSIASTYSLGYNIVENSVHVSWNGQPAIPNVDYTVDYIAGQVVIKNQAYLAPGSNLQIQYEANDLFQLASKSLVGARGDFDVGKNSSLGFTIMNLNEQSLSDKVRLGEEPTSNTIMGVDGGTQLNLGFLTHALNWLPNVQTNAASQISFRGEAAFMSPDPNTRKSSISGDNASGMAYIDDFEGAKRPIPLGVAYTQWTDASPPYFSPTLDDTLGLRRDELGRLWLDATDQLVTSGLIMADSVKLHYKARASWYNVPYEFSVAAIWGDRKSVGRDQTQETALDFHYVPGERGAYNTSMDIDSLVIGPNADRRKTWAGIQHVLGTTATNLLDENINFIEMWVKIDKSAPNTKLSLDLGFISEDVLTDRVFHTEDGLKSGLRTGILHDNEDVGLDGLTKEEEQSKWADFIAKYHQYNDDPAGDDYVAPPLSGFDNTGNQYAGANGTEGNGKSLAGHYPDSEDLNRNNVLDRINNYFEYEIVLDTLSPAFQKYVTGRGSVVGTNGAVPNDWYQVRIPLNEYARRVGNPTFTTVEGTRLWVTGAQSEVLFHIAQFNLIGNQWEQLVKNDSSFKVSTVSYEDDPTYRPPDPNLRTKDPTRPDETVLSNEQSLNLVVNGLPDGGIKQAIKNFPIKPLDVFSYKTMKMFVHGDTRIGSIPQYRDTANYDLEVFLRFGTDSLNYYEYREPVHQDWDPANDIVIHFDELTAIKFARDTAGALSKRLAVTGGPPGSTYQVLGEPTLTNIRYIAIGVENPVGKGTSNYSGEVWVDELRLIDVDNSKGWAYRLDTGLKLADLGTLAFSYTDRDPNFHSLEERFGSRTTTRNWAITANFGFERLLPASWTGSILNVSYSHVEGMTLPKYLPGTDVLVSEAVQKSSDHAISGGLSMQRAQQIGDSIRVRSETFSLSESFAIPTIKIVVPIDYWLVSETINKMTFGYSYNISRQRDPVTQFSESWSWNARFGYGLTFGQNNFIQPFSSTDQSTWAGLKFYYTPRNFNVSATLNRSQSNLQARDQTDPRPTTRSLAATRSMSFSWQFWDGGFLNLGTDYQVDIQSNLTHLELDQYGRQRSMTEILGDMFFSDRLVDFGIDQGYGQSININSKIVMPKILDLDKIFTPTARYSSRYNWANNIQAGALGKNAGWGSQLTVSLDISVKTISDKIWSTTQAAVAPEPKDSGKPSMDLSKRLDAITRVLFKNTLFDFERISVTFTQSNNVQNSGVLGSNGFANIFARVPFVQSSTLANGPSLLYQLGLSSDPNGSVFVGGKGSFPFIKGHTEPGLRAPGGSLADLFSQSNALTMRTSRPLWEGATINLNWNVTWSFSQNSSITTDALGNPTLQSSVVSGEISRSFLTFPPVLFFKFFKTGIEEMGSLYDKLRNDPNDTRTADKKIAQAFEDGFEAIPLSRKILGNVMPRLNWDFHWDGLEKFALFKSFAQRVSLDHSYGSTYRERWKLTPDGDQVTEGQSLNYGFNPLLGVNVTFKNFMKGNFGGTVRYGLTNTYDLIPSGQSLTEGTTSDITISVNYSRQGFEIPFFGLALSNDVDLSLSYHFSSSARRTYDFSQAIINTSGTPLDGMGTTTLEPRIRYILSSRVTASLFYRYTKVTPGDGGSRIPGSTVNEGGVEVHVAIQ